jgi:hypothetical protein
MSLNSVMSLEQTTTKQLVVASKNTNFSALSRNCAVRKNDHRKSK